MIMQNDILLRRTLLDVKNMWYYETLIMTELPLFLDSMIPLRRAVWLLESFMWPPSNQTHSKMVSPCSTAGLHLDHWTNTNY